MAYTGKQPQRIPFEKNVFESGGKFYFINVEATLYIRLKRFYEWMTSVVYGRKTAEVHKFIHDLRQKC